jgi:prepilin-type N-terminal cleavage/methylation domain-containing protein
MSRRDGFTLIELVVALLIGSIVLLGAHAMLAALSDRARALTVAGADANRAANGMDELRGIVGQLDVGTPGTKPFTGDAQQASFSTWCDVPSGWLERCDVTLGFDSTGTNAGLVLRRGAESILLVRGFVRGAFRYLVSASGGGQWVEQWGASVTAPLGIGAIWQDSTHTDTVILRIGPRG